METTVNGNAALETTETGKVNLEATETGKVNLEAAETGKETPEPTENGKAKPETTETGKEKPEATETGKVNLETTDNGKEKAETTETGKVNLETTDNGKAKPEAAGDEKEKAETAENAKAKAETAENAKAKAETAGNGKVKVVGVRFRNAGKIYYFDPGEYELSRGCHVIVETARGVEYGFVVGPPMEVSESEIQQPLKAVLRTSTKEDDLQEKSNREKEREAFRICRERIRRRGLEMKLIDAEYTFDNSKVLFYFTADGRIDFRELVKDLAGVFRTRIELRQVGVRDETKILGGYGSCGRPLCCHTWLSDFVPVSIKMAKEQNLSLNPGKISGVCGRLMCCLKNEAEIYEELNKTLPHPGDEVESFDGLNGLVESVNILRQTARIIVEVDDEKELHEYNVSDLTILRRRRRGTSRPTLQKTPVQKNPGREAATAKQAARGEAKEGKDWKEGKEPAEGRGNREGRDSRKAAAAEKSGAGAEASGREGSGRDSGGRENRNREYGRRERGRNRNERRAERRAAQKE